MLNSYNAPPGTACAYCGCDVSGTYLRKCIYAPAPEKGPDRIKLVRVGWVCEPCWKTGGKVNNEEDKNMSQITVTINAPELVSALRTLAEALSGQGVHVVAPAADGFAFPAQPVAAPVAPVAPAAPVNVQQPVQQPTIPAAPAVPPAVPAAPVAAPVPGAPVNVQQPIMPTAPVPTTTPTYTMEQLAVAATQLVDAGRRNELIALLGQFGVQALTALPKEQYGNFATALRQMGAQI